MSDALESWRTVWRTAAPLLPTAGLLALRKALAEDDPALIQGATTEPIALDCLSEQPVEAACLLAYCGWRGGLGMQRIADVSLWFADVLQKTDRRLGQPAACRWLMNFWDDAPRSEVIAALLPEVERSLVERGAMP